MGVVASSHTAFAAFLKFALQGGKTSVIKTILLVILSVCAGLIASGHSARVASDEMTLPYLALFMNPFICACGAITIHKTGVKESVVGAYSALALLIISFLPFVAINRQVEG